MNYIVEKAYTPTAQQTEFDKADRKLHALYRWLIEIQTNIEMLRTREFIHYECKVNNKSSTEGK